MLRKTVIYISITLVLCTVVSLVYDSVIRKSDFNKVWWISHIQKQKYDFAFLGNSRVYTMIKTDTLEKAWHKKGINISLDGADLAQQYLMLSIFLQNGNSVKDLYFNIDFTEFGLQQNSDIRVWCFLPYLNNDEVYSVVKDNYGKRAVCWKYIPMLKHIEFNSKIGFFTMINNLFHIEKRPFNDYGDFLNTPVRKFNVNDSFKTEQIQVKEKPLKYFKMIMELCNKNNINIHLYTAPVYKNKANAWVNKDEIIRDFILHNAVKYHATYYNFTSSELSNHPEYFIDVTHFNTLGVQKWMGELKTLDHGR